MVGLWLNRNSYAPYLFSNVDKGSINFFDTCEFEEPIIADFSLHPEQRPCFQSLFQNHVEAIVTTIACLRNCFGLSRINLISLISPNKVVLVTQYRK